MLSLAVTSTNVMIKKLGGKRCAKLHRLTCFITIGGVVHNYMIVKSDISYPVLFGLATVGLLVYRLNVSLRTRIASGVNS